MRPLRTLLAIVALQAGAALAEDGGGWEVIATGAITVKARPRPGTSIKELWAEGEMGAPVQDIQSALMDPEHFTQFMPYVKEARFLGKPEADGSRWVYTRLNLPMVDPRDYVLRVWLDEGVAPDGSGTFRNHWVASGDKIPSRHNVVRLKVNEGSWNVSARPGGKSWGVYKFAVDPGGWIPAFAADFGNKSGVTDTFSAVEKEGRRRAAERAKAPPPVPAGVTPTGPAPSLAPQATKP